MPRNANTLRVANGKAIYICESMVYAQLLMELGAFV